LPSPYQSNTQSDSVSIQLRIQSSPAASNGRTTPLPDGIVSTATADFYDIRVKTKPPLEAQTEIAQFTLNSDTTRG
jgi:hypothetical protein